MKIKLIIVVALLFSISLISLGFADNQEGAIYSMEQSIFGLINIKRNELNINSLTYSNDLRNFATIRTVDVANCFSHEGWLEKEPVALKSKYYLGELLAKSKRFCEPEVYVLAWLNSLIHRNAIFTPEFEFVGIKMINSNGLYYIVMILGNPK